MSYECTVKKLSPQPVMSVRGRTTTTNIASSIGEYLGEVGKYVRGAGGQFTGMPFTRIHGETADAEVDLEAGMPVVAPLPGEGRVLAGELPGGDAVVTAHLGPYDRLPAARSALDAWIAQHGRTAAGPGWEVYCNDPGEVKNPEEWKTELFRPLNPA